MGGGNGEEQLGRTRGQKEFSGTRRREKRSEMQKPSETERCTFLKCASKASKIDGMYLFELKYWRRYKGTFDIFFGFEHRMRGEDMEEQFNKESYQGLRFAADAAGVTDEKASSEDRKHT